MARITADQRKALPKSDFALPSTRSKSGAEGGYPIDTKNRARNALARVAQHGTPAQKAEVRAKVHKKYPGIGGSDKSRNPNRQGKKSAVPHEHLNPTAAHFDAIGR